MEHLPDRDVIITTVVCVLPEKLRHQAKKTTLPFFYALFRGERPLQAFQWRANIQNSVELNTDTCVPVLGSSLAGLESHS